MSKKEKKGLVPTLRFPDFRDNGGWEEKLLEKILPITSCKRVHQSDWTNDGVPFYRAREIVALFNKKPIFPLFISERLYKKNIKLSGAIKPGDLLVTGVGSIGVPYLVKEGDRFYFKDGNIIWLQNNEDEILGGFLYLLYESYYIQKQISTITGVGTVGTYTIDNAKKTLATFPVDKNEQTKIADCLASIDELITAQTQKIDALKAHKKGLMQQLFPAEGEAVPKLRFPEFRNAGEWDIKPLGKVAENLDFKRVPITEKDRVKGMVPYYGASGVIDYVRDYIFDEKLLCISEDGANLVVRTYPIAFSISGKTWVNNHAHVLKFQAQCTQVIVENYLNSINLEDYLTGMAQPKLNKAKLDIFPIPLPPGRSSLDEQQKIADCLSSIDDLITAQTQKLDALNAHKKGLMQQLFPSIGEYHE